MSLKSRLAFLRKEKGVSQTELAKDAGIHANVLGRYERGEASPSVEMAAKLADALGVSLDYLIGKTDMELDQSMIDKVLAIQKLPEADRKCIMYSIDGLIQHALNREAYVS